MMTVLSLWLPILIAAVLVFIASSVIHMMLGFHNKDVGAIPDERKVADALRPFAIPPGDYAMPHGADAKEMATPEFIQKTKEGPVAFLTVLPNEPMNMGKSLGMWFGYSLVVGGFAAYVAGMTLGIGAEYGEVFRVVAASVSRGIRSPSCRLPSGGDGAVVTRCARWRTAWSTRCSPGASSAGSGRSRRFANGRREI